MGSVSWKWKKAFALAGTVLLRFLNNFPSREVCQNYDFKKFYYNSKKKKILINKFIFFFICTYINSYDYKCFHFTTITSIGDVMLIILVGIIIYATWTMPFPHSLQLFSEVNMSWRQLLWTVIDLTKSSTNQPILSTEIDFIVALIWIKIWNVYTQFWKRFNKEICFKTNKINLNIFFLKHF